MEMRGLWLLLLGAWLALFAAACTPAGERQANDKAGPAATIAAAASITALPASRGPLRVGVTLHPYYSWTKNVAGEGPEVEVRPILPGEVDAGNYQPRPEDIKKITDLDAIVINGIGHDDFIAGMIAASGNAHLATMRPNEATPLLRLIRGGAVISHT